MVHKKKSQLSQLETMVMEIVWRAQNITAEDVRLALEKTQKLKDSTVRTILRRLEKKGFVEHKLIGRTYVYRARVQSQHVAADAVKRIIQSFCGGSVENLLIGMVDEKVLTPDELKELAKKIADAEKKANRKRE